MSEDQRTQPPLPFEPALQLVTPAGADEPEREVSLDAFTSLLFDEFIRRSNQIEERRSG